MTLSNAAGWFGANMDKVLIGHRWGSTPLGYYDRAYRVVLLPILFVHMPLSRLVLPMLAQTTGDRERYQHIFLRSYQIALLLTVPGIALLASATEVMVVLVMGHEWIEGVAVFRWLAIACLAQLFIGPLRPLIISQGRSRDAMIGAIATACYSCVAFVIGLPWGPVGVAVAYAVSELIRVPAVLWLATRVGPVNFTQTCRAILPFVIAAPLCFSIVHWLWLQFDALSHPFYFAMAAACATYSTALLCLLINRSGRECLSEIRRLAAIGTSLLLGWRRTAG